MVIDCHTHLSKCGHEGKTFAQVRDCLLREMDEARIALSFVYPDSEPGTVVSDLETTREIVLGCQRLLMLGTICVPRIDFNGIARLNAMAERGEIIGVKLYPGFEEFFPNEIGCRPIYELCLRYDMPVVFHSGETMGQAWREKYNHPHEIAKAAQQFPTLRMVVAHFAQPHLTACGEVVLAHPNVYADISGLAHPSVIHTCGRQAIERILEQIAIQQPEKLLYGTDWPLCDVGEHLHLIASLAISDSCKDLILGGNAATVFGVGPAGRERG